MNRKDLPEYPESQEEWEECERLRKGKKGCGMFMFEKDGFKIHCGDLHTGGANYFLCKKCHQKIHYGH